MRIDMAALSFALKADMELLISGPRWWNNGQLVTSQSRSSSISYLEKRGSTLYIHER